MADFSECMKKRKKNLLEKIEKIKKRIILYDDYLEGKDEKVPDDFLKLQVKFYNSVNSMDHFANIEKYLDKGAYINYRNKKGKNVLFVCCKDDVEFLLDENADPRIIDTNGNNCLMKNISIYQSTSLLLEKGLDLFCRNNRNQSIYTIVIFAKDVNWFDENYLPYLLEEGKKVLRNLFHDYLIEELIEIVINYFNFF